MSAATPPPRPRRWVLVVLAAIGVGLVLAPFAFRMFDRAPKGAAMIAGFAPYMTEARLSGYQREIAEIDAAVREAGTRVPAALPASRPFADRFPGVAEFGRQWRPVHEDMGSLLTTIRANLDEYRAVAALPDFQLFPWFFLIPGVLIAAAAAAALARPAWWSTLRWVLLALGIGLVLAPAAFQMFQRAPAGGRMMDAFRTIETRQKVETIQGYFGTIAVGEGAIRLDLVPALHRAGLDDAQIASRFPAVAALERDWTGILNDLTPMIGAMSDNVGNYAAVAALPPFPAFPWFFVVPGVLVIAGAAAATPRVRRGRGRMAATSPDNPVS